MKLPSPIPFLTALCLVAPEAGAGTRAKHPEAERLLESAKRNRGFADLDAPVFDSLDDGSNWVHGRNYKARIDAGGLTFIPFLGSEAPRDHPVVFRLQSASMGGDALPLHFDLEPIRDEQRVYVDHGSIVEIFDCSLDAVEHI